MHAILVSSLGVACAAAVAVAVTPASTATDRSATTHGPPAESARTGAQPSTRTIPLVPFTAAQKSARALSEIRERAARGVSAREVQPFSLLGVTWNDAFAELHGSVQVRTRDASTHRWSVWQDVQAHNDDAPDPASEENSSGRMRGSTAPLWVGRSDAVEVRVVPDAPSARVAGAVPKLPGGLRLDMVDPGDGPEPTEDMGTEAPAPDGGSAGQSASAQASAREAALANADVLPAGAVDTAGGLPKEIPAENPGKAAEDTTADTPADESGTVGTSTGGTGTGAEPGVAAGPPYIGPRPAIVTRAGWHADESLREREFKYTGNLKLAFVHHTGTGNNYACSEAPALIRSIYRYHVKSSGWRDIGYNFLIDKCGTIYEGRAGGVTRPVMGAHTYGFNTNSMGAAILGTFNSSKPPAVAVRGAAGLTAWKLGLFGVNPKTTVTVVSGGGKYPKGTKVKMRTIAGHRDGFNTDCPGERLYSKLGTIRSTAYTLQGRP